MRSEATNRDLILTISKSRLTRYLDETSGNLDKAIELYEKNIFVSETLYTPLQGLEVCLRNSINNQMSITYGGDWLTNGNTPLDNNSKQYITEALSDLRAAASNDDIVAKLKFAFWVSLLAKKYDGSLWRRSLYKCFNSKTGKKRSEVHGRMNAIRRFRNRVFHHEPILNRAEKMYFETMEAVEWMNLDYYEWLKSISRFNHKF